MKLINTMNCLPKFKTKNFPTMLAPPNPKTKVRKFINKRKRVYTTKV